MQSAKDRGIFREGREQQGPNFAGRYIVARWDCGADCKAMGSHRRPHRESVWRADLVQDGRTGTFTNLALTDALDVGPIHPGQRRSPAFLRRTDARGFHEKAAPVNTFW
jgi:hypothetical protein